MALEGESLSELTDNLSELHPGTGAAQTISVLRQSKYRSCYCGVEVYLHAFSAKALDGDVPLT